MPEDASFSLQTTAERERALLAPYAFFSAASRGRRHAEAEHAYRGPFQRDRDRIVHSAPYRRLSGKMQVFTGDMGDYHRTRLTHTLEVASIARTVARALRLNEDLVEALALLHDVGHPPFGHAGEDALAACLANEGGFSHNRFALTLVEELELRYPAFPGLNLSFEVLESQTTRIDKSQATAEHSLLEAQVVDAADSITYNAHDTDDAVKLGLVPIEELQSVPLVGEAWQRIARRHGPLTGELLRKTLVHELIDSQVSDLLRATSQLLQKHAPSNATEARRMPHRLGPSAELAGPKRELERFLYARVYRHERLVAVRGEAQARLRAMFDYYVQHAERLPLKFRQRAERVGLARAAAEYIAGMTDRFCDEQFRRVVMT